MRIFHPPEPPSRAEERGETEVGRKVFPSFEDLFLERSEGADDVVASQIHSF